MYVVAIGAEIPDTIQSVAVARRGYGPMALSNSLLTTPCQMQPALAIALATYLLLRFDGRLQPLTCSLRLTSSRPTNCSGSMAVSNSCGSQIINILVGLGLPWFITNSAGHTIEIKGYHDLELMSLVQGGNLLVFFALLLLATAHTWRPGDHRKAKLRPALTATPTPTPTRTRTRTLTLLQRGSTTHACACALVDNVPSSLS